MRDQTTMNRDRDYLAFRHKREMENRAISRNPHYRLARLKQHVHDPERELPDPEFDEFLDKLGF